MAKTNKRSGKTIQQQYLIYINELEKNAAFRTNKYSPSNPNILDDSWEELVIKLNSTGGPRRTVPQWKKVSFVGILRIHIMRHKLQKFFIEIPTNSYCYFNDQVFTDWKCNVRKRARIFKKAHRETGGGSPPAEKPLTEIETRLLSLTGKVVVDGMDITELGTAEQELEVNRLGVQKETGFSPEQDQVSNSIQYVDAEVNEDGIENQVDIIPQNGIFL